MDLVQSAVLYGIMTLVSTYLVAFAYKNVKFVLKHKVAQKREDAVSKEVTRKLSEADNRKMSRKEKDERILWKKNEVADYEATTFSIFYNNTLFLVLVIIASFFLLKNFNPTVNYILSISASSGLIALLSTGSNFPLPVLKTQYMLHFTTTGTKVIGFSGMCYAESFAPIWTCGSELDIS
uniref:Translocon-associated protein subunit gamma n=1 Tax=Anguilla anguilla TaxID=7936 RepID=A0A0E9WMD9_ANGAN